ncbi:MAG: DUF3102 domain-containing protein, partial [Actinomycetota bacterium]|nr:DUF3102 domain-containing protein [Actinomycetota bacterium]
RLSTADLADLANREHRLHKAAKSEALEHAFLSGASLLEVRSRLRHGEWLPWLKANFSPAAKTASRYMRLAQNRTRVSDFPSQRQALDAVGSPVERAKTKPPVPADEAAPESGVSAEHQHQGVPDSPAAQEAVPDGVPEQPEPDVVKEATPESIPPGADPTQSSPPTGAPPSPAPKAKAGLSLVRGRSPADPRELAQALSEGKAWAAQVDVATKPGEFDEVRTFIDAAAGAARARGEAIPVLVICAPDSATREALVKAAERALVRSRPGGSTRGRSGKQKPLDPVADAAGLVPLLKSRPTSALIDKAQAVTTGVTVSREDAVGTGGIPRLVLRRGNVRLSVPVPAEAVAELHEAIVVPDFEETYKEMARPGETFSLASTGDGDKDRPELSIRSGSRRAEIRGVGPVNAPPYPRAPLASQAGEGWSYEAGKLRRAIERTLPYAMKDPYRDNLDVVRFMPRGGGTRLVATDSFRLIKDDSLTEAAPGRGAMSIQTGDLVLLAKLLKKADPDSRVRFDAAQGPAHDLTISGILASGTSYEISALTHPGTYPNTDKLIPAEDDLDWFTLPVGAAIRAVKAALTQASEYEKPRACVEFTPGGSGTPPSATISLDDLLGSSYSETIPAQVPEDASVLKVYLNADYLLPALKTYSGKETLGIGISRIKHAAGDWTLKAIMVDKDVVLMPMNPA